MYTLELVGGAPICDQLEKKLADDIINGIIGENEKLPAVREIAKQLAINPNTVQKAYQRLEARNLIYSIPAKGSYASLKSAYMTGIRNSSFDDFAEMVSQVKAYGITLEEALELVKKIYGEGDIND